MRVLGDSTRRGLYLVLCTSSIFCYPPFITKMKPPLSQFPYVKKNSTNKGEKNFFLPARPEAGQCSFHHTVRNNIVFECFIKNIFRVIPDYSSDEGPRDPWSNPSDLLISCRHTWIERRQWPRIGDYQKVTSLHALQAADMFDELLKCFTSCWEY